MEKMLRLALIWRISVNEYLFSFFSSFGSLELFFVIIIIFLKTQIQPWLKSRYRGICSTFSECQLFEDWEEVI